MLQVKKEWCAGWGMLRMPEVMKSLLLNPPSFENLDGEAGSRWLRTLRWRWVQKTREKKAMGAVPAATKPGAPPAERA